ncbi:hypothetical protein V6N12_024895 [Hibiscus sabdariffa]|uniref:Uncharacterized protein n=1 Tax=Hibiscus sabdariffa TaxID=183260 RepID=A0ABR2AJB1_9ROSI
MHLDSPPLLNISPSFQSSNSQAFASQNYQKSPSFLHSMHDLYALQQMGLSKKLISFYLISLLLLFLLFQLEFSSSSHGSSLKKPAVSPSSPPVHAGNHRTKDAAADDDDDGIFDDEKRKVQTGPNPLHNR